MPEKFHGQKSLAAHSPEGCTESDTTGATEHAHAGHTESSFRPVNSHIVKERKKEGERKEERKEGGSEGERKGGTEEALLTTAQYFVTAHVCLNQGVTVKILCFKVVLVSFLSLPLALL